MMNIFDKQRPFLPCQTRNWFGVLVVLLVFFRVPFCEAQNSQFDHPTANLIQKSVDGVDLCFLPVETIIGAQAHVIIETDPLRSNSSDFDGLKATTLTVSNTGAPIVLILDTGHSNGNLVWRFNIEADAQVVGLHLISDVLPDIEGLPSNIPVTARYKVDFDSGYQNDCVYEAVADATLANFGPDNLRVRENAFRVLMGILDLPKLEGNLFDYAGIGVVSYQYSSGDWESATVEVSELSVRVFAETKARGKLLLDEAMPPDLPFLIETAEPLRVPEGLGRSEIWPWIISMGYAMAAPVELIEYNCEIDRLFGMSLGLDSHPNYCRWQQPGGDQSWRNGMVLLGSIEMSDETCLASRARGWIMSRPEVTVKTDGSNCRVSIVDINRNTFF